MRKINFTLLILLLFIGVSGTLSAQTSSKVKPGTTGTQTLTGKKPEGVQLQRVQGVTPRKLSDLASPNPGNQVQELATVLNHNPGVTSTGAFNGQYLILKSSLGASELANLEGRLEGSSYFFPVADNSNDALVYRLVNSSFSASEVRGYLSSTLNSTRIVVMHPATEGFKKMLGNLGVQQ